MSDPHPSTEGRQGSRETQIVAAARDAFAEQGFDGTSMAEIARRVGIVEGAIYRYVPSKIELLNRVIESFYQPLIASTEDGLAGIESPRDRLRFIIWRQLRAMTEDKLLVRLVISEARSLDGYHESAVADLSRRYTALAVAAIKDGIADQTFRSDLPATMLRDVLYGSIEHIAWGTLAGRDSIDVDATADALLSLLLDGVRQQPTAEVHALTDQLARLEALTDRLERQTA